MRLNILGLLASACVLSLPLSTFSRAIPHSSISARNDDAFPRWVTGVAVGDLAHLLEADTDSQADPLKSRATSTKPKPKPDAPDAPDVSTSDGGIDRGAGIQFSEDGVPLTPSAAVDGSQPIILPSNAGPASVQPTQALKPSATADSTPSTPSAPAAAPEGPQGIPEYCKGPANGLARRSDCSPGQSGDDGPGAGGIDSEPVPNQRGEVSNWFDEIEKPDVKPQTAVSQLTERIASGAPDIALKDLKNKYEVASSNDKAGTFGGDRDGVQRMLRDIGVTDINTEAVGDAIESKTGQRVLETTMSKDGKLIVADLSDLRDVDNQPVGDMRWNELVFSRYKSNMENLGTGMTNLEHVGRTNVVNSATIQSITTAHDRNSGLDLEGKGVFTFRADATDANERAAFDALSRTDNVNGVYWLLSDFHTALGDRKLTAIHSELNADGDVATIILDIEPV